MYDFMNQLIEKFLSVCDLIAIAVFLVCLYKLLNFKVEG